MGLVELNNFWNKDKDFEAVLTSFMSETAKVVKSSDIGFFYTEAKFFSICEHFIFYSYIPHVEAEDIFCEGCKGAETII